MLAVDGRLGLRRGRLFAAMSEERRSRRLSFSLWEKVAEGRMRGFGEPSNNACFGPSPSPVHLAEGEPSVRRASSPVPGEEKLSGVGEALQSS